MNFSYGKFLNSYLKDFLNQRDFVGFHFYETFFKKLKSIIKQKKPIFEKRCVSLILDFINNEDIEQTLLKFRAKYLLSVSF